MLWTVGYVVLWAVVELARERADRRQWRFRRGLELFDVPLDVVPWVGVLVAVSSYAAALAASTDRPRWAGMVIACSALAMVLGSAGALRRAKRESRRFVEVAETERRAGKGDSRRAATALHQAALLVDPSVRRRIVRRRSTAAVVFASSAVRGSVLLDGGVVGAALGLVVAAIVGLLALLHGWLLPRCVARVTPGTVPNAPAIVVPRLTVKIVGLVLTYGFFVAVASGPLEPVLATTGILLVMVADLVAFDAILAHRVRDFDRSLRSKLFTQSGSGVRTAAKWLSGLALVAFLVAGSAFASVLGFDDAGDWSSTGVVALLAAGVGMALAVGAASLGAFADLLERDAYAVDDLALASEDERSGVLSLGFALFALVAGSVLQIVLVWMG